MADLLFSETPIRALQDALSPLFDGLFLAITSTGSTLFLLVLVLLVYWLWDKRAGFFIGVVLLSSGAMNVLLKDLFQMPRPPSQLHITSAAGNGFPSGHAQQTTAFWSTAALRLRNGWVLLAPLLIGLVALSRVYLGVHFVGDVLGGIAFGLIVSLLGLLIHRAGFWQLLGIRSRLLLAVLLPSLLGGLYFLGQEIVAVWGLLMGLSVGYVLEAEWVGLGRSQSRASAAIRLLTGLPSLTGLYVLSLQLSAPYLLFPLNITIGLSATLLLPWLFRFLESHLLSSRPAQAQQ